MKIKILESFSVDDDDDTRNIKVSGKITLIYLALLFHGKRRSSPSLESKRQKGRKKRQPQKAELSTE